MARRADDEARASLRSGRPGAGRPGVSSALAHTRCAVAAFACGLIGCGGGGHGQPPVDAVDAAPDAYVAPWWQPRVGEAKNWDIQLAATVDVSAARTMYDLDLWSLVPAPTTLDYGDGDPVAVPAGAMAGTIAALHARTPPAIVICHV